MNTDEVTVVKLSGLTCQACQKLVAKTLMKIDGVKDVIVELETGKTTILADHIIPVIEVEHALKYTAYQVER